MNPTLTLTTVATVCGSVLFATASAGTPRYQMTQLRTIATAVGTYATVNAINDGGVVVGAEAAFGTGTQAPGIDWSKTRPILWDAGGTPTLLPTVAGSGGIALAVNNTGLAVGVSTAINGSPTATRATLFRAAGATLLIPGATNAYSVATGVNAGGVVAVSDAGTPYTIDTQSGIATRLGLTAAATPEAINDKGTVVGNGTTNNFPIQRPLRLAPGVAPTPLYAANVGGYALDVNNADVAVGAYGASPRSATVFANGVATTLTMDTRTSGEARGINDRNDVVGTVGIGYYAAADSTPFLRRDGVMVDLRTLITGDTLPAGFKPLDINDRGQIIGEVYVDDDNNASTPRVGVAYRLDPIRTSGDANDDGAVNFSDLVVLAQSYNKGGDGTVFWETGDFNYDWKVDFADLVILAQHYNKPASLQADWALTQSFVPEPMTLMLLPAAITITCGRGRRR